MKSVIEPTALAPRNVGSAHARGVAPTRELRSQEPRWCRPTAYASVLLNNKRGESTRRDELFLDRTQSVLLHVVASMLHLHKWAEVPLKPDYRKTPTQKSNFVQTQCRQSRCRSCAYGRKPYRFDTYTEAISRVQDCRPCLSHCLSS